jgi:hypothetical protein
MKRMQSYLWSALVLIAVVGCTKPAPGEQFLGAWINSTELSSGTILIDIERDNGNFLVRKTFTDSGTVFEVNSARFENGYLMLEKGLFKKMTYSERENALIVLDLGLPIPPFRKVVQSAPNSALAEKSVKAENSSSDVALAVTGFLQTNAGKYCDLRVAAFCGQSMETTTDGFKLRAKANRPVKSVLLNQGVLRAGCALLETAKAKLPTKLTLEVFDEHGDVVRIEGDCKLSSP